MAAGVDLFAIGAGLEVNVDGTLDVDLSASVRNSPIYLPSDLVYDADSTWHTA